MQLRNARMCLDCEELHEQQQCPVCASESFAFLTRWIPVDERRHRASRAARPESSPSKTGAGLVTSGIAGVAMIAIGRWLWRKTVSDGK